MSGEVKDLTYYNLLGIPANADLNAIKKAYRKKAMVYHPDKNPGSKEAEEIFKKVSEAYQVLSDPDRRRRYDQAGPDAAKESAHADIDLDALIVQLFGGGAFENVFGDPASLEAVQQLSSVLKEKSNSPEGKIDTDDQTKENMRDAKIEALRKQEESVVDGLAAKLLTVLEGYMQGNRRAFHDAQKIEADALLSSPGGLDLLTMVAYVYTQEGKQYGGRFFGLEGIWAEVEESAHNVSGKY
jgi:curved DNA-binding protein CbpA